MRVITVVIAFTKSAAAPNGLRKVAAPPTTESIRAAIAGQIVTTALNLKEDSRTGDSGPLGVVHSGLRQKRPARYRPQPTRDQAANIESASDSVATAIACEASCGAHSNQL